MYFVNIYENTIIKTVEIVLRRGGRGRTMEGVNLFKIHCKHMCNYHNASPCKTIIL
jgi:hypothetical protein